MSLIIKPLIFLLTFALTIINFIVLLVPIAIVAFPIFMFLESLFFKVGDNAIYFLISRISFLMIVYMIFDMLFGFTVRRVNRNSTPIAKAKSLDCSKEIEDVFEFTKKKFGMSNVELMIDQSFSDVNAYAVGSMGKKTVTLTMGLLGMLRQGSSSNEQYIGAVRGILGHEMSHLANKDYLPGLLTSANEVANSHVSKLIRWIFIIIANILRIIPFVGHLLYGMMVGAYNIINSVINGFLKWIFMPLYNFIKLWLGRSIEYRCDRDSAHAFGGHRIAYALSMLGEGAYFSLFSTHPRTKSRINYVKNIRPAGGTIRPSIFTSLANFMSIILVLSVFAYSSYKTDIPSIYNHYMNEVHGPLMVVFSNVKQTVMSVYYSFR